jgi:hypothetical protein
MIDTKAEDPLVRQVALSLKHKFNSCLIVVDEFHPRDVLDRVFPLLQPSCSIAIFHQFAQPLAELQDHLIRQKMAVFIRLEELWFREH